MNIAIIPARGGSKRIQGKNIRGFVGQPLISYSIQAARQANIFTDIVVSTDCDKIAQVATAAGASVIIQRPVELADDFTGTSPVVRHAIEQYSRAHAKPEFVCCIYATAPFLQSSYLSQAFAQLGESPDKQFAFSVATFAFPIQRALHFVNGGIEPVDASSIGKRSQDLVECYHDAGQFYWGRTQAWLDRLPMFAEHSIPIVLPRHLVQDIDTEEDWIRAELMYKAYMKSTDTKTGINNTVDNTMTSNQGVGQNEAYQKGAEND